jgi:hypothetical protein
MALGRLRGDWFHERLGSVATVRWGSALAADSPIADAISSGIPSFVIMCGGNRWINSKLVSPVVLASGKFGSALGVPQQLVYLRADNKLHLHFWNIADDYRVFFVDKGATKELINSRDARIQFHDSVNHTQVAQFSPVGPGPRRADKSVWQLVQVASLQ